MVDMPRHAPWASGEGFSFNQRHRQGALLNAEAEDSIWAFSFFVWYHMASFDHEALGDAYREHSQGEAFTSWNIEARLTVAENKIGDTSLQPCCAALAQKGTVALHTIKH